MRSVGAAPRAFYVAGWGWFPRNAVDRRCRRLQEIFTPITDAIFSIPIVLAVVAMILGWRAFSFRGKTEKGIAIFTLVYFTGSMPLHLKTWFAQNTEYILLFPWWYSLVFISYTCVLLWAWSRLKVVPGGTQFSGD